uniref:Integrase catalytic domain-containing protein n=1 Tax=Cacopsylla melanoneura TaxID=428564 RepID=A0A8D8LSF2_9HEMI
MEELALRRLEIERASQVASASNGIRAPGNINVGPSSNLPPIQLVKFDGTLEKYQEFSDNFQTLIDSKADLADHVKLHYLKSQLVGKAAYLIEGLRITNENYKVAMDILKEEYGAPEVIRNKIYHEIKKLKLYSDKPEHVEDFYRKLEVNFMLLENQGVDVNTNQLLASILFSKLPDRTQNRLVKDKGTDVNVKDIRDQMKLEMRQARMLKSLNPECDKTKEVKRYDTSRQSLSVPKPAPRTRFTTEALVAIDKIPPPNSSDNKTQCVYCDRSHFSDECDRYKTVDERKRKLGDRCFICLSTGHRSGFCRLEYRCWHCSRFRAHHRSLCPRKYSEENSNVSEPYHRANVLHPDSKYSKQVSKVSEQRLALNEPSCSKFSQPSLNSTDNTALSAVSCAVNTVVYMQTAVLKVYDQKKDDYVYVRVILDTASSHSYMSERLLKRLNLETGRSLPMNVYTFGALEPKRINAPEVTIKLVEDDKAYDLNLYVVPNIVSGSTKRTYDTEFLRKVNEQYPLADSFLLENKTQEFDILIGVDYYSNFILGEKVQIDSNLFLWNTTFGFVLSGTKGSDITCVEDSVTQSVLCTRSELCLDDTQDIQKSDLQILVIKDNCYISNEDIDLQSFESTLKFENHYSVDFPWKNDSRGYCDVQSNCSLSFGSLKSPIIKRHSTDRILQVCEQTLTDQLEKGILEIVPNEDLDKPCCYFPYHAVIRESSSTTKVRFVMDASARQNRSKPSLNDLLYRGPVLLENLCSLLLRFRMSMFALISDIEKAFLNIGLNRNERDFTRILWMKDVSKPLVPENLVVVRHTRLPFGVISSPFLLSCVIHTHLSKYSGDYIEQLRNNIYMDNILCGVDDEVEIERLVTTAREVFSEASLNLREWATNHPNHLENTLSPELLNKNRTQNTLGMVWDTEDDTLSLKFSYQYNNEVICKRLLLSVLASFFDILGLWTPIIMSLKVLVQSTWVQGKDWDEELNSEDKIEFLKIVDSMNQVSSIPVPRYLQYCKTKGGEKSVKYELHVFSDACSYSYASVVYLRRVNETGEIKSDIVFAKSRVAPTDKPTLPRLELLGALIAYRSLKFVKDSLIHTKIDKCFLWIDNQCVLHWLTNNKVLPVFVHNRVQEIKSSTFPITYRYIPTDYNPADLACRGSNSQELKTNNLWWKGPSFLSTHTWPDFDFQCPPIGEELLEEEDRDDINLVSKCAEVAMVSSPLNIDERKYGSFKKLVNITCYVKKFVNLCKKRVEFKGPIRFENYEESKIEWLRYIQKKYFSSTLETFKQGQSDLLSNQLGLELSSDGLLICKGRFRELKYDGKEVFPVLLPRKCYVTDIIVSDVHRACFHAGTSQVLATLRLNYWLPQGRTEVKRILKSCVNCKKFRQGPYKQPEFCYLPNYRVQRSVAFQYSAVDMYGPLTVKEGNELLKVHGLIFVCMTTRAVHLELLDTENTTDFLLAFLRFLSRRNACKHILSDNASQFKLVMNAFQVVYGNLTNHLNEKGIKFSFTSPLSPWEGGVYERLIGIIKQCLRKTLGHLLLSKVQLLTTLLQIENSVNCRPLGYVADEDMMITPNHFLGIKSDTLGPERFDYETQGNSATFKNLISFWKKGHSYLDMFWKAWVKQYLNSLRERKQTRPKQGRTSTLNPKVGEVVLIKDSNFHRTNWPYGTIVRVNHGRDSKVRNVDLRISNGRIITRPISLLYPLEFDM